MELSVSKEVIDWCNQQVDEGKELKFTWEGGGDSGWAELKVDDKGVSNEFSDQLLDGIYEELDYGSWAGEFYASGEAIYNKEEQAFIGTDEYQEDQSFSHPCNIVLNVPKNLWYDNIEIRIESDEEIYDENVSVNFNVKNGFISDEHGYYAELLQKQIAGEVKQEVDNFVDEGGVFRNIWQSITFTKQDAEETPDHIQYKITAISIGTVTSDDKYVELKLTQDDEE